VSKSLAIFCTLLVILKSTAFAQNAPSFDCSRATAPDERSICGNPHLSELDRLVAAGYEYVRRHYGDAEARRVGRPLLQLRHACEADKACIEERQLLAIKQFQSLGAPLDSISSPVQAPTPSVLQSGDSLQTIVELDAVIGRAPSGQWCGCPPEDDETGSRR
jgi:uncharacterized protein